MDTENSTSHKEPRDKNDVLDLGQKIDHTEFEEHAPIYEALVEELKIELDKDDE